MMSQQIYGSYSHGEITAKVQAEITASDEQNIIDITNEIFTDYELDIEIVSEKEDIVNIAAQLDILQALADASLVDGDGNPLEITTKWLAEQLNVPFINQNGTIKLKRTL